jgi:hypothetical protein
MCWEFDRLTGSVAYNEPADTRIQPSLLRRDAQKALFANLLVS